MATELVGPYPEASHHLKALREAGLIIGDKRGTWADYSTVRPPLGAWCIVIDPNCC